MKFYYSPTPALIGVLIVFVQPQNALAFSSTGSVKVAEAISPSCSAKIPTVLSTLEKICKQAENAEAEIDKNVLELQARLTNDKKARDELENLKNQLKKQLLEVINDEQKYQQALENSNLPQSQKDLLRKRTRWLVIRLLSRPGKPMKVEQVAAITGFSTDWVRKIARCYNVLGVEGIVDGHKNSPGGKQKALTPEQQKQLYERLQSPPDDGGLWSGPKVGELIKQQFGIRIHRTTAWRQLRRLGLTLQLPRPLHQKSATLEERVFFKAQLKFFVRLMRWLCPHKQVEVWAQDEARLGLKPVVRRTWALKGQRPVSDHYPRYKWLYTYGFVHPQTDNSCLFILPRVNTTVMQIALDAFTTQVNSRKDKLIILLVDQAGWHTTRHLNVPQDIIMYPIPPYTPQLNPTECIWPILRERLANKVFDNLDALETALIDRCQWLMNNPLTVKGEVGFSWLCSI